MVADAIALMAMLESRISLVAESLSYFRTIIARIGDCGSIAMARSKSQRLEQYRAKRDAERTAEPFGGEYAGSGGRLFVVQQHAARRLHYDFRIEMDGVLRSWAIPKGPSPDPQDKRLAVQVEDHPLEYAAFEGRIPPGNYGAGAVIVWDRGVWVPLQDPSEGWRTGKLLFELRGYKLRGKWTLVKTRRGEKDWLFIKERDAYVQEQGTDAYPADSILSGRTVDDLLEQRDMDAPINRKLGRWRAAKKRVNAKQVKVMLATRTAPFSRSGWWFELKYDGYRLIAESAAGQAALYSRAGNDLTATFPEIAQSFAALPFTRLIVDGEVVVHDLKGLPSFSALQKRARLTRRPDVQRAVLALPATFYAFDLLAFGDYDLRSLPLDRRKSLLRDVLPTVGPVRFSEHIETEGLRLFQQAKEMRIEGVIGKNKSAPYQAGRSSDWTKSTLEKTDDFVICGYTAGNSAPVVFGALLLAQYRQDKLVYAGRAGTGFKAADLKAIGAMLLAAPAAETPEGAPQESGLVWKETGRVCEVKYKQKTADGVLRQPVFLRLRDDKPARECRSDEPELPDAGEPPGAGQRSGERAVQITNPDKIFWPRHGYTKGDLIDYYRAVSPWMMPYLKDRPLVLTRYPDGIDGKSFFQKDAPGFAPDWIRREKMWSESAEREISYFLVEDVESLLYLVNMGTIPFHIWSSRIGSLQRPDWCVLDLDPKGAPLSQVVKIARSIYRLCTGIGLPSFVKTSGSTGLHVLIPLARQCTYEQSRSLGELLARISVRQLADIATITRRVSDREGRVYIDYVQNGHGRLLVAPFSARPVPDACVSMPLKWSEVTAGMRMETYTIKTAKRRMTALRKDPCVPVLATKPDIGDALERLHGMVMAELGE